MIDLHTHVLPGIDDGPSDLATAVEMARLWESQGVQRVVATPHVSDAYPNTAAVIADAVEGLNTALVAASVAVEIVYGAEVAVDRLPLMSSEELAGVALGGGPYVLVEPPLGPGSGDFEPLIATLSEHGLRVVLAHAERCPAFQRDPERLARLALDGALVSITAGSLGGRFGGTVRRFAMRLLEDGMVHNVASDAHGLGGRSPELLDPLRSAIPELPGLEALVPWLTEEVPAAILAGDTVGLPPRLERAARRSRWWRRATRA